MGRIKTALVKRVTNQLVKEHEDKIKTDFEGNKKLVSEYVTGTSKKIRNTIAGYVTRLAKSKNN